MKPGLGARLCQRCGTRVDERRGKFSPYCLSCGQPLDGQRISMPAPFSTATPVVKRAGGRAWIVALALSVPMVGVTLLLAFGAYRACASPAEATVASASPTSALPSVEAPATAAASSSTTPGKVQRPPGPAPTTPGPSPRPSPTFQGGGDAPFVPHAFPRERAETRFDQAMATIANCHANGDPTGSSVVDLTFEGDGRVQPLVHPPFAGTSTGVCINARLLGLRSSVGQFVGGPVTLRRAFTIP